jgi:hypothetical protein
MPTFSPAGGTYTTSQSVTISDTTAGSTIYYTTDGTTPTTASSVYSGPITVSAAETLNAIAVSTGWSNSPAASAAYAIDPLLPTPTFSIAAGSYSTAQTVTIGDSQASTTFYYTTNGTAPTTSSTKYTGAITVSATETIEAIAVATGYTNSQIATVTYTIAPALLAPVFSPAPGTYTSAQSVTISDATASALIYYTIDGTTPTTSSTQYTGAIWQCETQTLRAIAVETGYTNSPTTMAIYTIAPVLPTPTFSPTGGGAWATFATPPNVTISDSQANATFYYTINGTTPTTSSTLYKGPFTVSTTETVQAIAVEAGYSNSAVASMLYTVTSSTLPTPTFSPAAGTFASAQSVIISDSTAGTTIYYTTNGTTPTTTSTKYSGAITVSATETLDAIAVETGQTNSAVATAAYTINSAVSTPTFSPAAGSYSAAQTVTISDSTAGSTIYYTTNGTTPTTSSAKYSSAITVSATEMLEAIAVATGLTNSPPATAAYTITPVAAAPTFSPTPGTYTSAQSVTISDATAGALIYYTTNGTTPTTSSTLYTGAIWQSQTQTIRAIAVETGCGNSSVTTAAYTIAPVLPSPTFSLAGGPAAYATVQTVTISESVAGATIYYTTNSTTPTTSSTVYTGAITVSATETINAIAVASGYTNSAVASVLYTIASTTLPAPIFSLASGTYAGAQAVTISETTAGTTIYYTTNGTAPTTSSTKYSGTITISATETLEAIAVETGQTNSAVATAAYTITPVAPAPTFSPAPGIYTSARSVTISDAAGGAMIYYTTDGTTPTTSSTLYRGAIWQSATQTLKAIAVETGYANSPMTTAAYTIAPVLPSPTFSLAGGPAAYATAQTVKISDSAAGATIYYTTNGTAPTTSSTAYTGAITVSTTETINAIAVASGYTNSAVTSVLYTIAVQTSQTKSLVATAAVR